MKLPTLMASTAFFLFLFVVVLPSNATPTPAIKTSIFPKANDGNSIKPEIEINDKSDITKILETWRGQVPGVLQRGSRLFYNRALEVLEKKPALARKKMIISLKLDYAFVLSNYQHINPGNVVGVQFPRNCARLILRGIEGLPAPFRTENSGVDITSLLVGLKENYDGIIKDCDNAKIEGPDEDRYKIVDEWVQGESILSKIPRLSIPFKGNGAKKAT